MRAEQGGDLLLEEVSLEGAEQVCRRGHASPEMFDACVMLGEGDDIGDGFFVTVIVTDDTWQFDAHPGTAPGSSGQCIGQVIFSEF